MFAPGGAVALMDRSFGTPVGPVSERYNVVGDRVSSEGFAPVLSAGDSGLHRLIAQLATRFITLELEACDAAVVDGLREVAEALQLDRAILWQQVANRRSAEASHFWIENAPPSLPELTMAAFPFTTAKLQAGEGLWFANLDELPDLADRDGFRHHGVRSAAIVPVVLTGSAPGVWGALALSSISGGHEWAPATIEQIRVVAGVLGQALARIASLKALELAHLELAQLRAGSRKETVCPRPSMTTAGGRRIIADSQAIQRALEQVEQVAPTPSTVLLLGETGVGKEVFAQAIHALSTRRRPMVRVSCAAIPSTLIESELFGHERGAYTGAVTRQIGRFEAADQSTLFLDEIGELPAATQVKLLRVLQERTIERLGSTQSIKVDVRIIAATNRDLEKAVAEESFREDLFYRLNVFPIVVPPLRERVEDIPGLLWQFIDECASSFDKSIESISEASMRQLQVYSWPGNIRELRNVIERAVILATGPVLTVPIPERGAARHIAEQTLRDLEIEHIRATLERTNWRIRGRGGAAERLGLKPTTLETRMSRLGISRPMRDTSLAEAARS
jgi:formate hydrogenlyase transcriptional activator